MMTPELLSEHPSGTGYSMGQSRVKSRWRGRWPIAAYVSAVLVLSVALAYASPPDPSWVSGIYDDRDNDDVVGMVTEGAGVSDSRALPCIDCVLVGFVLREATGRIPGRTVCRQTIRGPPPIESGDASVDLLPASLAEAPRPPNIPLIAPDQLSRVAATYVDKLLRGTRPEIFLSSGPRSSS